MEDSEMDESIVLLQGEAKVVRGEAFEESDDTMFYAFDDSDMFDASEFQAPWSGLI